MKTNIKFGASDATHEVVVKAAKKLAVMILFQNCQRDIKHLSARVVHPFQVEKGSEFLLPCDPKDAPIVYFG